jgi:hypothetical protein
LVADSAQTLGVKWATLVTGQAPVQYQDEGSNLGAVGTVSTVNFTGAGVTASRSTNTVTVDIPSSSGQVNIQMQDEGSNLGTSGTVDTIDFVGAGVTASRASNTLTVTIAGGSGLTQDQVLTFAAFRP